MYTHQDRQVVLKDSWHREEGDESIVLGLKSLSRKRADLPPKLC